MAKGAAVPIMLGMGALLLLAGGSKRSSTAEPTPGGGGGSDPVPDPCAGKSPIVKDGQTVGTWRPNASGGCDLVCARTYTLSAAKNDCLKKSTGKGVGDLGGLGGGGGGSNTDPPPTTGAVETQEFVDQSRWKKIQPGATLPPGLKHNDIWVSDDCRSWVVGKNASMRYGGGAGKWWWENRKTTHPEWDLESDFTALGPIDEYIVLEVGNRGGAACAAVIPKASDFNDEDLYSTAIEQFIDNHKSIAQLMHVFRIMTQESMLARLNLEKEKDPQNTSLLEGWATQRAIVKLNNEEFAGSDPINDATSEAYWWAYPDCPHTLPAPSVANTFERACIDKWNRLLNSINSLYNSTFE